jgi:hypothetical protein
VRIGDPIIRLSSTPLTAGQLGLSPPPSQGLAAVLGAVHDERRAQRLRAQRLRAQRLRVGARRGVATFSCGDHRFGVGVGVQSPADGVLVLPRGVGVGQQLVEDIGDRGAAPPHGTLAVGLPGPHRPT